MAGQQVPAEWIFQNDPEWLKINYPQVYSGFVEKVGQPAAQLNQTQTSTAATGAEIPGIQASSAQKTIQAQQAASPLNLKKDLTNGMTLKGALSKYTALGMSADDVFKNYLSQNKYGPPKESPSELIKMGIKPETLGQIGQNGSFQDIYNTRNAIEGVRALKDQFNKVNAVSKLPFLGDATPSGQAYDSARQIFGEHLSSLIPGGSNASGSVEKLLDTLPGTGDLKATEPGAANARFDAIEKQLLNAKGYSYSDLGLSSPPPDKQQQKPTGNDLLNFVLGSAMNSAKDIGTGTRGKMEQGNLDKQSAQASKLESEAQNTSDPTLKKTLLSEANNFRSNVSNEAGDISKSFSPDVKKNPLIRALTGAGEIGTAAEIPSAAVAGKEALSKIFGGGARVAETTLADAPGGIKQLLQPGKSKQVIGAIRDNIIKAADNVEGNVVNGDKLAQGIRSWADSAKLSNLPDANAIEEAAQNAENLYKGKTFKPSDVKAIYDKIEKGYTATGQPRSATSAYIDRGLKGVMSNVLDDVAPGFKKTSELFDKVYAVEKGPLRAGIKNAAKFSLPLAVGQTGGNILAHILFGQQ